MSDANGQSATDLSNLENKLDDLFARIESAAPGSTTPPPDALSATISPDESSPATEPAAVSKTPEFLKKSAAVAAEQTKSNAPEPEPYKSPTPPPGSPSLPEDEAERIMLEMLAQSNPDIAAAATEEGDATAEGNVGNDDIAALINAADESPTEEASTVDNSDIDALLNAATSSTDEAETIDNNVVDQIIDQQIDTAIDQANAVVAQTPTASESKEDNMLGDFLAPEHLDISSERKIDPSTIIEQRKQDASQETKTPELEAALQTQAKTNNELEGDFHSPQDLEVQPTAATSEAPAQTESDGSFSLDQLAGKLDNLFGNNTTESTEKPVENNENTAAAEASDPPIDQLDNQIASEADSLISQDTLAPATKETDDDFAGSFASPDELLNDGSEAPTTFNATADDVARELDEDAKIEAAAQLAANDDSELDAALAEQIASTAPATEAEVVPEKPQTQTATLTTPIITEPAVAQAETTNSAKVSLVQRITSLVKNISSSMLKIFGLINLPILKLSPENRDTVGWVAICTFGTAAALCLVGFFF
ncbi:hypothetical protein [Poriferisphaera sp. WC338]|uniref:hypothetical protein n=1 Tax=Poriferisphaera sp. WC338 TaxID=3425129 RepID=UPI003D8136F7